MAIVVPSPSPPFTQRSPALVPTLLSRTVVPVDVYVIVRVFFRSCRPRTLPRYPLRMAHLPRQATRIAHAQAREAW